MIFNQGFSNYGNSTSSDTWNVELVRATDYNMKHAETLGIVKMDSYVNWTREGNLHY